MPRPWLSAGNDQCAGTGKSFDAVLIAYYNLEQLQIGDGLQTATCVYGGGVSRIGFALNQIDFHRCQSPVCLGSINTKHQS